MKEKKRLDVLLVERGFAATREKARAYIILGKALVNEQKVTKPGTKFDPQVEIRTLGVDHPYVSRGGLKLEKALREFGIVPTNQIAMDIGASTGGFTDCLLQHGVSYVFAVDVGVRQLDWKLQTDPRVKNLEKSNFRYLTMSAIGTFVDLIVMDVSFISLTKMLENCLTFLTKGGKVVCLIKPQFEAGKSNIEKGGVVKDQNVRKEIIENIITHATSLGYGTSQVISSPIQGKKSGNQEYLICLQKT